ARRLCGGIKGAVPLAALCGALLLLAADYAAQHLFLPYQLPVGVITVSLGGLYLITLLVREARRQ
ncbi:iron chelate uptake ABC transporter family permease subunit, partial [Pantoea piersonii]|uniref:iron chelate uptake ABC transporter family permease subunit n=1 Tax=Pantoea piersonii TaxID=2364647 RepID=UPI00289C98C9